MHHFSSDQENLVVTQDVLIRCAEYCPEVNVLVTGTWGQSVKFLDSKTPCNAGTFSRPEKVCTLSVPRDQLIVDPADRGV